MAQNIGKIFESQISKSIPNYVLMYRLPDSAQVFGGGNNLRFSRKNPFDFIMYDSKRHILYALEMKTVSGKSISFERNKNESKEIHYHQIQGLNEWNKYDGIIAGFIIEFRQIETTVFIDIDSFNSLIDNIDKKSFSYDDLKNSDSSYVIVPQEKKRTRYIYDIESLLSQSADKYYKNNN